MDALALSDLCDFLLSVSRVLLLIRFESSGLDPLRAALLAIEDAGRLCYYLRT